MSCILSTAYLEQILKERKEEYQNNKPFPHVVIDNFLPVDVAEEILRDFPSPQAVEWKRYDARNEVKLEFSDIGEQPDSIQRLIYELNSHRFLLFLQRLSGIQEPLISDPYLEGGGLHQIESGGFLNIHIDFNKHKLTKLDRRINLLLYFNKNWKDEYNGHLELWNQDVTACEKKIAPIFNRCVIFNTTDFSYHGHPEPLRTPNGVTRKSIALYYYSNGRPASEINLDNYTTGFKDRPNENTSSKASLGRRAKWMLMQLIPPIVTNSIVELRQARRRSKIKQT